MDSRWLIAVSSLIALPSCTTLELITSYLDPPKALPSIDGPEDERLLDGVRGSWIRGERDEEDVLVVQPDLSHRDLRLRRGAQLLSGPDQEGRIAYLHGSHVRWREISTDIEDLVVDLGDSNRIVTSMALAPRGGRVLVGQAIKDPSAPGKEPNPWELLLCAIGQSEPRSLGPLAVDQIAWMPDGVRAIVEVWVGLAERDWPAYPEELANDSWTCWQASRTHTWPSIQMLDTETGDLRWLAWGRMPCVSPDGRQLLFMLSSSKPLRLRDLHTGEERPLDLPGLLRPSQLERSKYDVESEGLLYGWLSDRIVVYDALSTTGRDPGFVPSYGMQGYYPKWTVKAADVTTGAFRTLIPSVDNDLCFSISPAYGG